LHQLSKRKEVKRKEVNMADNLITVQTDASIARVCLNRPERRNALTREMIVGMTRHLTALTADPAVRLIEIAAEGPVFCAGMDLAEMQQRAQQGGPSDWLEDAEAYRDLLLAILKAPQPVLARVQGPALAGGVGIVLACDMVIAADNAFFALPEPQRGIAASMVTPLLLRKVGAGHAGQLLMSGQRVTAAKLESWGVYQQVVPSEHLNETVAQWRTQTLTGSPQALEQTKTQLRQFAGDITTDLHEAAKLSAKARGTTDAQEGLAAFLEKRTPSWQNDLGNS